MSMTTTHFTDALFEDLAETNYSTHKTIDWATLDREVKLKFGNNLPADGPTYIASDGTFINDFGDVHADLCYWAAKQNLIQVPENLLTADADWEDFLTFIHSLASNPKEGYVFVGEPLNYIRCNNNLYQSYVILPTKISRAQLYSLEEWFEHLYAMPKTSRPDGIELCAYNEKQQKYYELDNYDPKALIKKVQRFYASGKFYESKLNH